jgi:hypothetical protein
MLTKPTRLRLDFAKRIDNENSGEFEITVQISFEERLFRGQCRGYINESDELELAASAALQAVEDFVQRSFECQTIELDRVNTLSKELIVLLINVRFDQRELQIFGSCLAAGDLLEASARAALDATNRFVELTLASDDRVSGPALRTPPTSDFAC